MKYIKSFVAKAAATEGTGTVTGADFDSHAFKNMVVFINVTAIVAGVTSLTVTLHGKDPMTGAYIPLGVSAAIAATGTFQILRNVVADPLFAVYPQMRISATVVAPGAETFTYSVNVHAETDYR